MEKQREYWCDFVRAIACIMVIALHVSGPFIDVCAQRIFSFPLVIESATRPCVPFFFMLSGYLWFKRPSRVYINTIYFRFVRATIPLCFYTFIFLLLSHFVIGNSIVNAFTTPVFYHLWFFYTFLVVSLFLAIIKPADIDPLVAVLVVAALLLICSGGMVTVGLPHAFSQVSGAMVYVLYAVLGHYMAKLPSSQLILWASAGLFIVATSSLVFITSKISSAICVLDQRFFQYDGMLVVVQAIVGFYILRNLGKSAKSESKFVKFVSINSLGIYGLHPLPLYFLLLYFPIHSIYMVPVIFLAFSIALAGSYFIRKLPFGTTVA